MRRVLFEDRCRGLDRHHHDLYFRPLFSNPFSEFQTVHSRHLHVRQEQMYRVCEFLTNLQRFLSVVGRQEGVTLFLQHQSDEVPDHGLIFGKQDHSLFYFPLRLTSGRLMRPFLWGTGAP